METKSTTVNIPISQAAKAEFDAWWRRQPNFNSCADAVRKLMQEAVEKGDRPRND